MGETDKPNPAGKGELLAAFDKVVDREKEKIRTAQRPLLKRRTSVAVIVVCILAWGALGYTWLARPAWLFSADPALARTSTEKEATLRFGMYLETERVWDFVDKHQRLPVNLGEAGDVEEGVSYEITGDRAFVLTGTLGTTRLTLSSSDDVQAFLEMTGIKPARRGQ